MTSVNNSSELHIWDNAAFDCGDSYDATASIRNSWSNVNNALHYSDKENHNTNKPISPLSVDVLKSNDELQFVNIDKEIEDVEKEIDRLSRRLTELKREKAEKDGKTEEKRGRVAFLELDKKEIISATAMTRRMIKEMNATSTPLNQKSFFWKLDKIDELKMAKERGGGGGGKRFSLSPRSTKSILKLPKQAATTVKAKKTFKMDERVATNVQPKKLFKEEPVKKAVVKAGRVVASKYNSVGLRKRSLPENDESKENEKKRASLDVKSSSKGGRVKKKWEIPTEVVVFNSSIAADDDDDTYCIEGLPKIRTARCIVETPRDSGAVKRAADKKSLCQDGDRHCQSLNFFEE